jgi:hypothetical protein
MTISTVLTVPTPITVEHVIMSESPSISSVVVMASKPFTTSTVVMIQRPITVQNVITGLREVTMSRVVNVPVPTTMTSVIYGLTTVTYHPVTPAPSPSTIHFTYTVPPAERDAAMTSAPGLEERKDPKKNVVFTNPYTHEKVCARAEWEDAHDPSKAEVRIKHTKKFAKCHGKDFVDIDRKLPPITVSTIVTHVVTRTVVATPTDGPIIWDPIA